MCVCIYIYELQRRRDPILESLGNRMLIARPT